MFLAVAAALTAAVQGVRQPWVAAAFAAAIAFGEAIRIDLPMERDAAPLAQTATLAFVFCISVSGARTRYGVVEVVAVAALAKIGRAHV